MPINKDAQIRMETIDECLRTTTKKWSKNDLLRAVNRRLESEFGEGEGKEIAESQLRKDMKHMARHFKAPIKMVTEGRSRYYEYENPDFSIKDINLEADELSALNETARIWRDLGMPMAEYIEDAISKLQHRKGIKADDEQKVIYVEKPAYKGYEHIYDLWQAIIQKKVIRIHYKKRQAEQPQDYIVHPYAVKEYNGRWYLLCYSEDREAIRKFALDAIREMWVAKDIEYRENTFLSVEKYFHDVIGVTVYPESEPEDVFLWFSPAVTELVTSKPLHHSQFTESEDRTGVFLKLHVIINPELISAILGYGNDARVIGPESLKQAIKDKIDEMCRHYD